MKIFSAIRKHAIVLTTLLVIVALGFIYLFIYLPQNEKIIREQRFHVLQDIDKNIHAKIDNSVSLMKNLLAAYEPGRDKRKENEKFSTARLDEYVKNAFKENFTIIPHSVFMKKDSIAKMDSLDDVYTLDINNKTQQIVLKYSKKYSNSKSDTIAHAIGMRFSFDQFISFLLPQHVFDEYIIFSNGKTVYETFPAGISYVKGDSLMGLNKGMSVSSLHDFNISGKNYKVFLQPVHFTSETEWVIGGLLSDKRYQTEKKQLPFQIILLLITLAFCLLVSAPWIKLFHMGSKDRLTVVDGAFSILVSMLLVSVLFLTFFKYNLPFRSDDSPDSKTILANNITAAFKKEIDSAYIKLNNYNRILKEHLDSLGRDIIYKDSSFIYFDSVNKKTDTVKKSLLVGLADDTSINHLFWLKANGDEIFKWTRDSFMPPHGNFASRNYFKNIKEGKTFRLISPYDSTTHEFYFDQVISWTTGGFTSVLSIPFSEKSDTVAAISFRVKSLVNTILPTGYQFALINKGGQVLYHSQPSHNLNENLLDKFSARKELQSCLNAHAESTFLTDYLSRNYNVKVKPLTGLPYFILILSDTAFKETRDLEIYSFTFTMLVLFFAFLILEMLIIFFASAKRSFFKKHLFDTSWVGPKSSGHYDYILSAFFNIIIIILLISLFSLPSFLSFGFMLMFSVSYLTLFLNQLYYKRYKETTSFKSKHKRRSITIMIASIAIIDLVALRMLHDNHFGLLMVYEFVVFLIGMLIYYNRKRIREKISQLREITVPEKYHSDKENSVKNFLLKSKLTSRRKWLLFWKKIPRALENRHYVKSFTLMVLSRLVITSGIPVVFFYISSYNYEQNIIIRYKMSEFANQLVERLPSDSSKATEFINQRPAVYIDSSWIKSFYPVDSLPDSANYTHEEDLAINILNGFRPDVTDEAVTEERFYIMAAADSSFFFNSLLKDACTIDTGTVLYRKTNVPGNYLKVTSTGLNYNFPILAHYKGSLFWLVLTVFLILFFFLLQKIIKKLFALKIPDLLAWEQLDENILCDNKINNRIFVIGSPGVKKRRQILKKIKDEKIKTKDGQPLIYLGKDHPENNVFVADLINIPDDDKNEVETKKWEECKDRALRKDMKLVIVSHFEYNIENGYANRIKLNFLEALMLQDTAKIMILSTVHPMAFLDSIFFEKRKEKTESPKELSISSEDIERWNVLLGHYSIVLLPLGSYKEDAAVQESENKDDLFEPSILEEIEKAQFLYKMKKCAIDTARTVSDESRKKGKDFNLEELAFKLQLTSHYFYMYIWQSLTKEEKFLLYDLAEDNLVNTFDDHNLGLLIGKGIICRNDDGTLKLFNKGFRNFILTAIGNSEAMKIKDRIKDNGNWGKWRTPLIIIFMAILLFLMASQEEVYTELLTYIGALGAGIPIFFRLLSFFDKGSQKTS